MELGQRLKQARLEAGMSQRQLCGDVITRNMLSQIENGSARPSMDTLRYLAAQLGRPIAYFLEEEAVQLPNRPVMDRARALFAEGNFTEAARALSDYAAPDPVYDPEKHLLQAKITLGLGRQAIDQGRLRLARQLLEDKALWENKLYVDDALNRQRLLLMYEAAPEMAKELLLQLPGDDRELLLRAAAALAEGKAERCGSILAAVWDGSAPECLLLRARAAFAGKDYAEAVKLYSAVEAFAPGETRERLEECYRMLEDYKMAYHYACLRRDGR